MLRLFVTVMLILDNARSSSMIKPVGMIWIADDGVKAHLQVDAPSPRPHAPLTPLTFPQKRKTFTLLLSEFPLGYPLHLCVYCTGLVKVPEEMLIGDE